MRVTLFHAEKILDGSKTALLMPAIPADHYQIGPDDPAQLRDESFEHNRPVWAIYHAASRQTLSTGQLLPVRALPSREIIQTQVIGIRMVECARLSDGDLRDLGYPTRAAYMAEAGQIMARRKAWFIRLIPVALSPLSLQ